MTSLRVTNVPMHDPSDDRPKEECGVLGISTPHGDGVAQLAFFGLFALQHRGQEAAGIAVSDGRRARVHKEAGLVANVFSPETLAPLVGYHAIGHTRYSTTGSNAERNIQPFLIETMHGPLALAHNGNLVNATALRDELLNRGFGLTATSDSEVLSLMLAAAGGQTWQDRIERTLPAWKGAFSLVILAADQVIAVRDPWGFRPLSVGRLPGGGHAVASETCALATLGCVDIDEVQPGEMVTLRGAEVERVQVLAPQTHAARCSFEFVYFSRPDSVWHGRSVHHVRQQLGIELAREAPTDADVVIPVPDSSIPAAIGYSQESGIRFNDGLIKNRYIGRTFIEPTQDIRERGVALKFNALRENLEGRRVVDDRRLARAGHHCGPAGEAPPGRRRRGGPPEDHVPTDHARLPLRRRHGPRRRPHLGDAVGRGDPPAHRRRQPGVPLARRDDAGDRQPRGGSGRRLLQRLLHREVPAGRRRRPGETVVRRRPGMTTVRVGVRFGPDPERTEFVSAPTPNEPSGRA